MDIEQLVEQFYNENVETRTYGYSYGGEFEVDQLMITEEEFKNKIKKLISLITD